MKLSKLKLNPTNPRIIKDEKFKKLVKSIQEFPEMMEEDIVFVSDTMVILGKSKNGKTKLRLCECRKCGEWFNDKKYSKERQGKYCSRECYAESLKLNKRCKFCGSIIENKHSVSMKNRIYCSRECHGKARRNIPLSNEWKKALSEGRKNSDKCKGKNLYNWKGGKETEPFRLKQAFYKRKKGLKEKMPIEFLQKVLKAQDNKCFFCECDLTEYKAIEHLTPVSKGGDNNFYNLVYSCKSCNSKKRQKTLEEFALSTGNIHWLGKWEHLFIETL